MSGTALSGYRWATVTAVDRSGILYIITILGFVYTSIAFLTRVLIKWHILGWDDGAMLVAQLLNGIQFILALVSLSNGLAKSFNTITTDQYVKMASTYSGGQTVIYLSLGFSKIATMLLVRRLFIRDMKKAWTTCNIVVCAMAAWTIASAILVSAGCSSESLSPKAPSKLCSGIEVRYMIVVITDGITDIILAVLPAYLCRRLQMNFIFKLQVLGIFALRLPLVVLASLFFEYWKASLRSNDMDVTRTTGLVFQQTQLCVSLIAGTVPCLRSFIQSFDTGSGVKAGFGQFSSSGYGNRSGGHGSSTRSHNNGTYELSSVNRNTEGVNTAQMIKTSSEMKLDADVEEQTVEMERHSTLESDRKSQLSTQELVIRKDVRWEITREAARKDSDTRLSGLTRPAK